MFYIKKTPKTVKKRREELSKKNLLPFSNTIGDFHTRANKDLTVCTVIIN